MSNFNAGFPFQITGGGAVTNEFVTSVGPTGVVTLAQPSAANLSNGVTGTGAVVLANTPTLITPVIGSATGTSLVLSSTASAAVYTIGSLGKFSIEGGAWIFRDESVTDAWWIELIPASSTGGITLFGGGNQVGNPVLTIVGGCTVNNNLGIGAAPMASRPLRVHVGTDQNVVLYSYEGGSIIQSINDAETAGESLGIYTTNFFMNGVSGISQTALVPTSLATTNGIVTTFTGTSDERLKNTSPYVGGLDKILNIHPVKYTWNKRGLEHTGWTEGQEYVGFIAQDVQKSIPEAVTGTEGAEEYLSLDDRPIIAALVNAIKELEARIKVLEA
jgi:hypothetical protein